MRYIRGLFILILSSAIWMSPANVLIVQAQQADCPGVVQTALTATQELCDGTGRNQACYGHVLLDAQPQAGWSLEFASPGDKTDVTGLRSLHLSAMDTTSGVWGVTRMELRANLPQSRPENLTLLMFGDVTVSNGVAPAVLLDVTTNSSSNANVRLSPTQQARVIGTLSANQTASAVGRLADSSWLRVELPGTDLTGWVFSSLLTTAGDVQTLPVEEASAPHFGPMQAFYFESGADAQSACSEMPGSGFLIQTPEGAGEVNLLINEVNIHVGSTVYFQAQRGGEMIITTLEGKASVQAMGVEHFAFAGTQVRVPLTEDMTPAGPPLPPEPYDLNTLTNLPIGLLNQQIAIAEPLTYEQIAQLYAALAASNGGVTNLSGDNTCQCEVSTTDGTTNCTGIGCNPPGQDPTCPLGNSCNTPGHDDECPGNSCNTGEPPGKNK